MIVLDLINQCLKQIKLQILLTIYAPLSELPSNKSLVPLPDFFSEGEGCNEYTEKEGNDQHGCLV